MSPEQVTITVDPETAAEDIKFLQESIRECAIETAVRQWPDAKMEPLTIVIRNEQNTIVGGLVGELFLGGMMIKVLWLAEEYRNQDYGTKLMQMAENWARQNNAQTLWLDTYSYQAPKFYEKLGFEQFGFVQGQEEGPIRQFYKKIL
jgi:GNAT superfamily N-acetyltransferase